MKKLMLLIIMGIALLNCKKTKVLLSAKTKYVQKNLLCWV